MVSTPAPGALELVRQFVNSNDIEDGQDRFQTVDEFCLWCAEFLGVSRRVSAAELADAVLIREGIRGLAMRNSQLPAPEVDFTGAVDRLRLRVVVRGGRLVMTGGTPLGEMLAPLLEILRTAQDDGSFSRLKACKRDTCHWLFYDRTRNRSATWCTTDLCGSREKAKRAYYRSRPR